MIITVTLNAAMDKTLEVPSFTVGRRHRTVDQTTMPGGKGVNIARAIKRLGQPVIATGLAGGPTGSRIVEALNDESILNDFVRISDESRTNTAVLVDDLHTEINERGPAVSARSWSCSGRSCCIWRRARRSACSRTTCPRSRPRHLPVADPGRPPRRRHHDDRHRRRAVAAVDARRADLVSPNEVARGRGARRPRVQRFRRSRAGGGRDDPAGRARGDHDGLRRLLRADLEGRLSALYRVRIDEQEARSRSAPATRSWPAMWRLATPVGIREECLRFGVACGAESPRHSAGILMPGTGRPAAGRGRRRTAPGRRPDQLRR